MEALFAGAPIPVIQAYGGWARGDTLQFYLAEAVRRSTSVFQVVLKGHKGAAIGKETEGRLLGRQAGGGSLSSHLESSQSLECP